MSSATPSDRSSRELPLTGATSRDLGVPPTLDLAQHARDLRSVALPALLVALLVAAGVFTLRTAAEPQYEASVLARVDTAAVGEAQDITDGGTALQASYAETLADTEVLASIIDQSGVGWTTEQAQSRIAVTDGPASGLLQVTARGATGQQAAVVAAATVPALASAVRQRRLQDAAQAAVDLRTEAAAINSQLVDLAENDPARPALEVDYQAALNRIAQVESTGLVNLAALSDPSVPDTPVSPYPLRDALLALLVTLILVAELGVLVRGRLGRGVGPAAARRIAQRNRAGVQQAAPAGTPTASTIRTELLATRHLDAGRDVLLLRGPGVPPGAALGLDELRPGATAEGDEGGRVVELAADGPWWRSAELAQVGLAILVLARRSPTGPLADRTLRALSDAGVPAVLALGHFSVPRNEAVAAPSNTHERTPRTGARATRAAEARKGSATGTTSPDAPSEVDAGRTRR